MSCGLTYEKCSPYVPLTKRRRQARSRCIRRSCCMRGWTAHHPYCIKRAAHRTQRAASAVQRAVEHRVLACPRRVAVRMQRKYVRWAHGHAPAAAGAAVQIDSGNGLVCSEHACSMPCSASPARGSGFCDPLGAAGYSRAASGLWRGWQSRRGARRPGRPSIAATIGACQI